MKPEKVTRHGPKGYASPFPPLPFAFGCPDPWQEPAAPTVRAQEYFFTIGLVDRTCGVSNWEGGESRFAPTISAVATPCSSIGTT